MASKRPTFPKPSDEMKRFAALLEAEVQRWPGVRTGAMFGMVSVYRGKRIFALLPATRSLYAADSIMVKRSVAAKREGGKWQTVPVQSEADLPNALKQLGDAYQAIR
jgi:hypothetical protein